jgi:hypothetical protein
MPKSEQEAVERRSPLRVDRRDQIGRRDLRPALAAEQGLLVSLKMSAGD